MAQLYSAYLDESGTHEGSDAVAVAGFISNRSKWQTFSDDWKNALDSWKIPYFHMSDYETRHGFFESWDDQQREERLNHLLGLIKKHTFLSVAYIIRTKQFNEILSDAAKKLCGNAYGLAAIACWFNLRQLVKKVNGYIDYTMEKVSAGSSILAWIYREQVKYPEWVEDTRLLSLSFEDKKVILPLQAADILAYEIYKHAQRQFSGLQRPERYPYKQLFIPSRNEWHYADDAELKRTNDYLNSLLNRLT